MVYKTSKETQERKDMKKQHILDTAAKVFAARGYHHTTVKDIVDEADISIGSFYFYFKSKEELFAALYAEISQKHADIIGSVLNYEGCGLVKSFSRAITASLWAYQQKRDLTGIMMFEAMSLNSEFKKKWFEVVKLNCIRIKDLFRTLSDQGKIDVPDLDVSAMAFEGTYFYLIFNWLEGDDSVRLTDSAFSLTVYNLQAIKAKMDKEEVKKYIEEVLDELEKGMHD
ncbi:MAG: TetR/AcrR family transcriptional regulator [Clostridia bacterium]|nr:TetR/AcrR family transcriptional regulator [Clostridia bacterium]